MDEKKISGGSNPEKKTEKGSQQGKIKKKK